MSDVCSRRPLQPEAGLARASRRSLATAVACAALAAACASEEEKRAASAQPLAPVGQGFNLNASDVRFIMQQIRIAEAHVAGGQLLGPGPNQVGHPMLPFGLRTVDGTYNNIVAGQSHFGAADRVFPRLVPASFRPAENAPPSFGGQPTTYLQKKGLVFDSHPRTVSNLIVDQTPANPAAVAAAGEGAVPDFSGTLFIPNVAPDVGLSAPYNSLFTLFGQFFDHGLDLVTKGGGTVFVLLQPDDPLFVPGSPTNFMVLTRATNQPGPDGVVGDNPATPQDESADDVQEATNTTTPFVDQNQTYTSHPSHQVFLREYELAPNGRPRATGRLVDSPTIEGNIASWSEVKAQARTMLGIELADVDVLNVPLLATDPYGRFLRGANGFPMVAFPGGVFVEGNPSAPISVAGSLKTGHAFLDDIAHHAAPFGDHDSNPGTPPQPLLPDADPGTADDGSPATYDDELLGAHFVTGDGRGNENIGLTTVHTVFHSEHNRLVGHVHDLVTTLLTAPEQAEWAAVNPASGWDYGERLFQAARFVTEMEYQHLVFEEFARKVQPMVNVFAGYHTDINPAITAEFAHTVYRFGHSMLTEVVARRSADGENRDIALLDAFLNPLAFNDGGLAGTLTASQAAGEIVRGMAEQVGNEIDEFVTEALRNNLLGLPLDLATINLARGRSEGVPGLNAARRQFFLDTGNSALAPYESWADLSLGLRHPDSVVNFIAAYGRHPSITGDLATRRAAATAIVHGDPADPAVPDDSLDFMLATGAWANVGGDVTGVDDVDFWVGGLAEKQAPFGGLLGSTFNHVFETQLEKLQDGDRFYYLTRTAGLNLLVQLEGNSFAELVMRNTDAENLPADAFSRPDFLFNLAFLGASGPILDDPNTAHDESAMPDLIRMPNGTVRYTGPAHVIFAGTDDPNVVDRIWSSEGDDTLRGNGGRDVMEGGSGNDSFVGGEGDDVLTDAFGDDNLKGGDGNDFLSSGPGFDLNQGGRGHDFIVGGSDPTESFGGPGNDFIFAGDSADTVFGDDGDDWIEGGGQADLLQGDNGAPFQNDPNEPGNDVIIGDGGDDDYDAEGGDDIMVTGPGIERNEGMLGFDWVTHRLDPQPADADLRFTGLLPPDVENVRDRFDLVEGLSGWVFDDVLRGDDADAAAMVGHELVPAGVARIAGLQALLGGATSFTGGNIIIGGPGSDVLEGRGGNDLIDGDAWLNVQLRAPNPNTADPSDFQLVNGMLALRADVLAGRINPGDVSIVRSIVTTGVQPTDVDTAVFSGPLGAYLITVNPDGTVTVDHQGGVDGVDTLRNVELLAFLDGTIPVPTPASGTVTISDTSPTENQLLTVTANVTDPDGVNEASFVLTWQAETAPDVWADVATGPAFSPGDAVVGRRLRVVASFLDNGTPPTAESVVSDPTLAVAAVNDPPVGAPALSDPTPQIGAPLSAVLTGLSDADGLPVTFAFQWRANGVNITNARAVSFTPTLAQLGQQLSVVVTYTDGQGFAQSVTSPSSAAVTAAAGPIASAPGTFAFGLRRVNTSTVGQINVTNPGTAPLVISSVTAAGNGFLTASLGTCAAPLAPGGTCRVTVTFRPTAPGTYTGSLTLVSNAVNSPTIVALTGSGR